MIRGRAWIIILFLFAYHLGSVVLAENIDANLRFSHKTHNQNSVTCSRCHIDTAGQPHVAENHLPPGWQPLKNSRILASSVPIVATNEAREAGTFARPGEKLCLECHFQKRNEKDCALCHLDKPGITLRVRNRLPKYAKFDHSNHTSVNCYNCHSNVTNWETLNGNHTKKRMEFCLECHDGRKVAKDCKMCHNPTPRPRDHVRNYSKKHGVAYRSNPSKCKMCHQESSCVQCHARKPRDHTLAWTRRNHGFDAKTNMRRCNACHSDKWVCKRCHTDWR